jgi:hypothetical protein
LFAGLLASPHLKTKRKASVMLASSCLFGAGQNRESVVAGWHLIPGQRTDALRLLVDSLWLYGSPADAAH